MQNMTEGAPRGHLLRFALPLLLANWLQLAYNAVDSIIAGRFIGQDALAAEGVAAPMMNLVILAISGLCIGAGVLMSEAFGASDAQSLRQTLATTLLFGAGLTAVMAVAGILFTPALLRLLAVPADIFAITGVYLRITFLGAPFTFFYNALAAGFKSVGDTKTPLKILAFSAVLNAVLDLLFLGLLGFGIACSATTTVVAEAASALVAAWLLAAKAPSLCPQAGDWRINRQRLAKIWQYGSVTALQQAVQPVGKLLIQGQVNALGVSAIAAFNAVGRADDFACIPEQGISAAISTYLAQNRGAQKRGRLRSGFAAGIRLELCYGIGIAAVAFLLRRPLVSLFVKGEGAAQVIELGSSYLGTMAFFYLLPALTNGVQGFFRGMGKMKTTLLGTVTQTTLRVVFTVLLAPKLGLTGVAYACAAGWCAMLAFEIPYYFITCKTQSLPKNEKEVAG